jgi:hypothetical protein
MFTLADVGGLPERARPWWPWPVPNTGGARAPAGPDERMPGMSPVSRGFHRRHQDRAEPLLDAGIIVEVRVVGTRKPAVRLLDLLLAGVLGTPRIR